MPCDLAQILITSRLAHIRFRLEAVSQVINCRQTAADPFQPVAASAKEITLNAIIYVKLLDEGTDVWRPVDAEEVSEQIYRLVGTHDDEKWEFETGSSIRVEEHQFQTGSGLVAVAIAD